MFDAEKHPYSLGYERVYTASPSDGAGRLCGSIFREGVEEVASSVVGVGRAGRVEWWFGDTAIACGEIDVWKSRLSQ